MRIVPVLLFALLVAAPAAAAPRSLVMARVSLEGLDLGTDAGARAMIVRLDLAARTLCALPRSPLFPGSEGRAWRCRRDAVSAAVARLRTPSLELAYADWLSAEPDADPQARNPG